ncbi:hypothetical protein HD597_009824 [Nonomuraea thailandensis]|uniref:Uncharacterized protein n=1 Tax=Nonomuraea thailandensis TaxID=1188745 RepID=A0A9X2GNZ1_9ACTN|nr:hypothetical protein [Nonomuraea thailandensis]
MTTRPSARALPPHVARPYEGRISGNVAAPETHIRHREATCRKDSFIA